MIKTYKQTTKVNSGEIWILLQMTFSKVLIVMHGLLCHFVYSFLATLSHGSAFFATNTTVQQNPHISLNWMFSLIILSSLGPLCGRFCGECCLRSLGPGCALWWWPRSMWPPSATTQPLLPVTWRLWCSWRYIHFIETNKEKLDSSQWQIIYFKLLTIFILSILFMLFKPHSKTWLVANQ